jgi:hypothetical protein
LGIFIQNLHVANSRQDKKSKSNEGFTHAEEEQPIRKITMPCGSAVLD